MSLVPLGQTARFINGAAFKPSDWGTEGLPIIRIQNLTGTGEAFNYTTRQVKPELVVEPGDLLVSWSATLDVYRWGGPRGVLNQHIFKVIPNPGVDADYLYFALKSVVSELENKTHGSTMKHVVRADFEGTRIPLPPLAEQRRIVDVLSRADGIVRLRREAQRKAAEFIPTVFLDMFGDPSVNQMCWPIQRLDQVAAISYGIADKLDSSVTAESGIRILTISNVLLDGSIDMSVERYCTPTDERRDKAAVRRGDLLFNWRNGSEHHIGKTAMWEHDDVVLHVSFLLRLRPTQHLALPHYLWAMLNRLRRSGFFIGASRQQINRKFNASELSALGVPIPPISIQKRFADLSERGRALLTQQTAATSSAEAAFQAILAGIFSGNETVMKGRATSEEAVLVS